MFRRISFLILIWGLAGIVKAQAPLAEGQSKFLGCAYSSTQQPDFVKYWNQITPENGGKWGTVEYARDLMRWTEIDAAYSLAGNNDYLFKNHTMIWGNQQPAWIESLDTAQQREEIEEWFSITAARFGSIDFIDVVNEPLHAPPSGAGHGNYMEALGGSGASGWDWVIRSFKLARKYFPTSKLLINEYNIVNSNQNTLDYIDIINLLIADSLIDGIGVQAHAFSTRGVAATTIRSNLNLLAATGLPIYATELDIDGSTDYIQFKEYQRVFPIFWEHPAVAGITLWGFRYGLWRTEQGAYLVDASGRERPAFEWLKAYVNDTLTVSNAVAVSGNNNSDTIYVDETLQMIAELSPDSVTFNNVTWSTNPATIATINASGLLTPVSTGIVTVSARSWDSGQTGTTSIVIIKRLAESVTISSANDRDTITTLETLQLEATVLPENVTVPGVNWTAIPPGLALISAEGLLTPIMPGIVTVIATAKDGSGVADSTEITVEGPVGSGELPGIDVLSVYPNPSIDGRFNITELEKVTMVSVLDLYGRVILNIPILNQHSLEINLSNYHGIYILRLSDNNRHTYRKIVAE